MLKRTTLRKGHDLDLVKVLAVWLELPRHVKAANKALVKAYKAETK